jgi:hypothetical protein
MQLDEYKILAMSVTALDVFVGSGTFEDKIEKYRKLQLAKPTPDETSLADLSAFSDLTLGSIQNIANGLLVWIDDRPDNNKNYVAYAQKLGITVLELNSTAEAKIWVDKNMVPNFLLIHY